MKICPGCGSAMEDSAAFCTKCGTKFNNNSAENTSSTENTQNTGTAADSGTACNPNNPTKGSCEWEIKKSSSCSVSQG